jgi:Uncharacterized conserved protein, contains double-stranded beta-helix domain
MKRDYVRGNWNEPGEFDWVQVSPLARRFAIPGSECTVAINMITLAPELKRERPPHKHPHEQVMLILEGNGALTIDGESYPMHAGSYFVIPANVEHCFDVREATANIFNIDIFTPTRDEFICKKKVN